METQTLLALLIVVAAGFYMVRRLVRTVRTTRPDADGTGCASGCGCAGGERPIEDVRRSASP